MSSNKPERCQNVHPDCDDRRICHETQSDPPASTDGADYDNGSKNDSEVKFLVARIPHWRC
ncbi:hypothetical protein T10_2581 [Trichinella papuae]|uniref:Uncharacterized protein n=1 Tax=Trichinella papuae TaxID=268474 RepID=A0A0V1MB60_9BILA|nr:hypothetical protein T10_2581 [Trichinella papuae]